MQRDTYFAKPGDVERRWRLIDAEGQVLGRLAVKIATILMGKDKPQYTPHCDVGDFVVVTNAAALVMTGRKADQKFYKRYSGYPGGLKHVPYGKLLKEKPEKLLELAVRRMLPKSSLGAKMLKKMKVYPGAEHPHHAQQPEPIEA